MKTFHLHGPTWAFFTPEQMYGEEAKLRSTNLNYQNADLYILTKMRKVFFDESKTRVTSDGHVLVEIKVGNPKSKTYEIKKLSIPLVLFTYEIPSVKETFKSMEHCFFNILYNQYAPKSKLKLKTFELAKKLHSLGFLPLKLLFRYMKYIYSTEIRVSHENLYEINVYDPIIECTTNNAKAEEYQNKYPKKYALNNTGWDLTKRSTIAFDKLPGFTDSYNSTYKIDQIVNLFNIDVGGQEILYIGKTEQEDFNRLLPHDKLNMINARHLRNDFESNVIHLLGFQYFDSISTLQNKSIISKPDAITIAEASLINYFKPKENTHYVKNDGIQKWKHRKLLKTKKFTCIKLLLDIDGQYTKFYTKHLNHEGKNSHDLDIKL